MDEAALVRAAPPSSRIPCSGRASASPGRSLLVRNGLASDRPARLHAALDVLLPRAGELWFRSGLPIMWPSASSSSRQTRIVPWPSPSCRRRRRPPVLAAWRLDIVVASGPGRPVAVALDIVIASGPSVPGHGPRCRRRRRARCLPPWPSVVIVAGGAGASTMALGVVVIGGAVLAAVAFGVVIVAGGAVLSAMTLDVIVAGRAVLAAMALDIVVAGRPRLRAALAVPLDVVVGSRGSGSGHTVGIQRPVLLRHDRLPIGTRYPLVPDERRHLALRGRQSPALRATPRVSRRRRSERASSA